MADISFDSTTIPFVVIYAPSNDREKANFWAELNQVPLPDNAIVTGDFN